MEYVLDLGYIGISLLIGAETVVLAAIIAEFVLIAKSDAIVRRRALADSFRRGVL
jgi:hypothetical protein